MKLLFTASVLLFLSPSSGQAGDSVPPPSAVVQHVYGKGETLRYFFEDTDYLYDAKLEDGLMRAKAPRRISGVRVNLTVSVLDVSSGTARRRVEFSSGAYRSAEAEKYNQTPFVSLSSAIPGFPPDFGYEYDSDAKIVNRTAGFFQPFLSSEAGVFVYYKTMDIHSFQSIIDTISDAQRAGEIAMRPAKDIPLGFGVFKNAASIRSYDRIETVEGIRCAVFKVATLGNEFRKEKSGGSLRTDYQLTMYVPLEGEYRGLLLRGDLQEYVFEKRGTYILRQLSMTLQTKETYAEAQ